MAQSEMRKRIIWGAVFGSIVIGSVLFSEYTFYSLCAIISILGIKELLKLSNIYSIRLHVFSSIGAMLILFSLVHAIIPALIGIWTIVFLISEMVRQKTKVFNSVSTVIFSLVYLAIPLLLLLHYSQENGTYEAKKVLTIFFLVWSSDTFAYFSGKILGKTPLFPVLSPKKTIEGLAGGTIMAAIVGVFISYSWSLISIRDGIALGILVSLSGTAGDLFESALKRNAGVKDSGNVIPGHGGILDRFDAFLFACVVVWAWDYFTKTMGM